MRSSLLFPLMGTILFYSVICAFAAPQKIITVTTQEELKKSLLQVTPGTTIVIASGFYSGGMYIKDIYGTFENPIVITGADPENPPIFEGVDEGAKLSSCSYVKLGNLIFQGFPKNGINIDDGAPRKALSHHISLENVTVRNTGPRGNNDALKLSGVDHFVIRNCQFEKWGGAAIDMVGCHHGLIEGCQLWGDAGFRNAGGIQIKGGSRFILVQNSTFRNAGERTISIGGMTGPQYFRPSITDYEARDIILAGNTFVGGETPIAWVTAQESHVHHNLFFLPGKWVGRILQETKDERFKPSGKGFFEKNMVVTDARLNEFFNVGWGTDPDSFVFSGNAWFRPDSDYQPNLPTTEQAGIYDLDPMILDDGSDPLQANSADPRIKQVGPWNYVPWRMKQEFADVMIPPVVIPEKGAVSFWDRFFN